MKSKIISFTILSDFCPYSSTLFPKSRHRDFKLIQFQIGVLEQSLRGWVPLTERLFKNFFVSSNMRELYGDRISRIIKRINNGEKYGNGEYPRDIYDDLRLRAQQVRAMQNEVLTSLYNKFDTQGLFKIHDGVKNISKLNVKNKDYLEVLFSKEVSFRSMGVLLNSQREGQRLSEEELKYLLFSLESHGLIRNGTFTERFKQELIDDDPTLFEYEKTTPFKKWIQPRSYYAKSKILLEELKQQYLLSHLQVLRRDLLNKAINSDVGMVVAKDVFSCFIPFPRELRRVISLPFREGLHSHDFIFTEDVIRYYLQNILGVNAEAVETKMVLFVRNVNVPFTIKDRPDERKVLARGVLSRNVAEIVMMEVETGASEQAKSFLKDKFKLKAGYFKNVPILRGVKPIEVAGRIDPRFVVDFYKQVSSKELKYEKYLPVLPHYNSYVRYTMFQDFLFHWPYHAFILDKMVHETIDIYEYLKDPSVLGSDRVQLTVYQSLYRTGEDSGPMQAMERAAQSGANTYLISEIKARLDEISNFKWARRLSKAGVDVHYSMMKKKIHTKVTVSKLEIKQSGLLDQSDFSEKEWQQMLKLGLIEEVQHRKAVVTKILNPLLLPESLRPKVQTTNMLPQNIIDELGLTSEQQSKLLSADICYRFTHVGTGNIRESTAKSFEDVNTASSNPALGRDCEHMFKSVEARALPDEPEEEMWYGNYLKVHLREKINAEIAKGSDGYILLKVNQLEDDEMIDLLYQASMAGVKIEIFVRGFNIIRTANLEPLSLTNADIEELELKSDKSRIISNKEAIQLWDKLKKIGVIDEDKLVSKDYLGKRKEVFSVMTSLFGQEKARKILFEVMDESFRVREFSENIRLYRTIDRHLEHSRIYVFGKGDSAEVIIGSADVMKRNIRKRLEANRVIKDNYLKKIILDIMEIYKTNPAHMQIMTTNERYYLMEGVDQSLPSVQEHELSLYHHTKRDDGYASKWLFDYYLGSENTNEIWNDIRVMFPENLNESDVFLDGDILALVQSYEEVDKEKFLTLIDVLKQLVEKRWE